ncbi:unnamed protein product, partial [Leptidea sinapis]
MSVESLTKTFCDSSGSDIIEEDIRIVEVQPLLHQEVMVREKRLRSSSDDILEEDGFTTVRSKRAVKIAKKSTRDLSLAGNEQENLPTQDEKIIVAVTGNEILPKQFKFAKILRSENILNITNIRYKSPFKIIIEFEDKKNAQKLIECKKIVEFRCQLLNEMGLSYGIIRNVDLDICDEEIKGNLESDLEIVSVRRLKRLTITEWVESETIRIGFRGSVLPTYVRMDVVTQCSGCWKFGHNIRYCPSRKIICPKCTGYHTNCEITVYKCINCKGKHMALDKSYPVFLKEKNIRIIMRDLNYTYQKALSIYLTENGVKKRERKRGSISFMKFFQKLKEIYLSECTADEKIKLFIGFIIEEIMNDIKKLVSIYCPSSVRTVVNTGFTTLNNGEYTRIRLVNSYLQKSSPDITFVSSNIAVKLDWKVMNECLGSDHLCIKMQFNYSDEIKIFEKRNIKCANWQKYKDYIKNQFQNLENEENPHFNKINNKAANVSIPMIKVPQNPTGKFIPRSYWSPSLSHKVAQRRLALREFRRNPIPNNLNVLEKKHSEARSAIYKGRAQDWLEFCDSIDEATTSSTRLSVSEERKFELLCELAPDYVIPSIPVFEFPNKKLDKSFSLAEMNNCLKKKDTDPGCNGITYSMIWSLPKCAK